MSRNHDRDTTRNEDAIEREPPREQNQLIAPDPDVKNGSIGWETREVKPNSFDGSSSRNPTSRSSKRLWLGFSPDIARILASLAILISITVVLVKYNGRPEPSWKFSINMNSLIALLTSIFRASMLTVVSEALSQLKWTWFSKLHVLSDLDVFDQATRGFWGSLAVLFSIRKIHPILLGAAITVLSLGIGPFAQQAIKSVPCQLPRSSEIAKLSVIHDLGNKHVSRQGPGIFQIDYATKGAVINGVANPGINVQPLVDCSTGNCTFPPLEGITHSSLGVCTRCMDVASQIVEETDDETGVVIRLPSMIGLSGQSSQSGVGINVGHMPASFDGTDKGESTFNANWEEPYKRAALDYVDIMAYTVAGCVTNGSLKADRINANYNKRTCPNRRVDYESLVSMDMDVVAVQCIYYPCLRNYAAEVHAGVLSEKLVSSVPATPDSDLPGALYVNYTAIKEPCFIHNQAYDRGNFSKVPRADLKFISYNDTGTTQDIPEECLYQMEKPYAMALIAFLTDVFTSNGTMSKNQRQDFGSDNDLIDNIWFQDTWWLSSLWNRNNATVETINSVFESMAAAFTNQVRVSKTANVIEDPQWIYGTVFETNVCTRFEWQWLLFPVFLLSATLVLLLITAGISYMDTHQIPIWKSSLLPLLFYGLEDHNFGSGSGLEEEMKNNNELLGKEALSRASAKKLVRFRRSEIGARFEEVET